MIKVAIVGKANVGKSTLFNALVDSYVSLEFKKPGTTRDRIEAVMHTEKGDYVLIDTGGIFTSLNEKSENEVEGLIKEQTKIALEDSQISIVVFDGREGLTPLDSKILSETIKMGKPCVFVVNKVDSIKDTPFVQSEFLKLNLPLIFISARRRKNLEEIKDKIDEIAKSIKSIKEENTKRGKLIRLAFVGRPNVGKSSIVNAILGSERCIVHDKPWTTRDAIRIPFTFARKRYVLVDTPGVRRRSRVKKTSVEFKSVGISLKSIQAANVCVLVIDAFEGVTRQDKRLASLIKRTKKRTVVAFNKIDLVEQMNTEVRTFMKSLSAELGFTGWTHFVATSALTGKGINKLMEAVRALGA